MDSIFQENKTKKNNTLYTKSTNIRFPNHENLIVCRLCEHFKESQNLKFQPNKCNIDNNRSTFDNKWHRCSDFKTNFIGKEELNRAIELKAIWWINTNNNQEDIKKLSGFDDDVIKKIIETNNSQDKQEKSLEPEKIIDFKSDVKSNSGKKRRSNSGIFSKAMEKAEKGEFKREAITDNLDVPELQENKNITEKQKKISALKDSLGFKKKKR